MSAVERYLSEFHANKSAFAVTTSGAKKTNVGEAIKRKDEVVFIIVKSHIITESKYFITRLVVIRPADELYMDLTMKLNGEIRVVLAHGCMYGATVRVSNEKFDLLNNVREDTIEHILPVVNGIIISRKLTMHE